ncbi:F-box domain, cyclin-like protein [Niveomyces insectorum RCEF 264]|uniref:F-box domain, cyclin-like protein n=1 Tax=Niveomyces insectorum RCEF 264 TaxID=1081102 RepID=A0A167MMQ9_9HYPO|nr:F-box domain, cyclin-like protein [Niveomyces insectorum RCEF 264]
MAAAAAVPAPTKLRSTFAYDVRADQVDAIVRVSAFHRIDYDRAVIWFPPSTHDRVRQSIATPFPSPAAEAAPAAPASAGLGILDQLPAELAQEVLLQADLQSLFTLRQTSRGARQAVDALRPYQVVTTHALDVVCAVLRTGLAADVPLHAMYDTLCSQACALCDAAFAGFVFLFSWTRCCFACLQFAPQTHVQTPGAAQKKLGLTAADMARLPVLRLLPGTYGLLQKATYKARMPLVSVHQAWLVSGQPEAALTAAAPAPWLRSKQVRRFPFMACCALPSVNRRTGVAEIGLFCAGCQLAHDHDIDGAWGEKSSTFPAFDELYTRDGFVAHFRWCEHAQYLWRTSEEGTTQPAALPTVARRRGFFEYDD